MCRRCHQYAPQLPESCRDCLAFGVFRINKWLCGGCLSWRYLHPGQTSCVTCRCHLAVNDRGACRLCWSQTREQSQRNEPIDVEAANRHGQQLMLANMSSSKNGYRSRPRRDFRRPPFSGPPREPAPAPPWPDQLDLFAFRPIQDPALRYGFGDPPDAKLAVLLDQHACEHARDHGWNERHTTKTRIALRVLLAMRTTTTTPVLTSEVMRLVELGLPVRPVLAVLDAADVLAEDRVPSVQIWFDKQITGLPEPIASELRIWFDVLHHGSSSPPRSRPRDETTIRTRLLWALPTLHAWAEAGHHSLREITREQVIAVLPAGGTARTKLGNALRSIFTTLKQRKVIFSNPTARMNMGNFTRRIPLPADTEQLRAAFNSADPVQAALTALIGIHGLRLAEVCALQLSDVRDTRVHLPDRRIPLAAAAKTRLSAHLDERTRRWPDTANPHYFVNAQSALDTGPVSRHWIRTKLGIAPHALRQDRIVDEAHVSGGDLRRICDFFGVTMATAEHYANTLNHPDLTIAGADTGSRTQGPD